MEDERTTRGGQTSSGGSGGASSSRGSSAKPSGRSSKTSGSEPLPDQFAFSAGQRRKSTAKKSTAKSAAKPAAKKSSAKTATAKKSTAKTATAATAPPQETPTETVPAPAAPAPPAAPTFAPESPASIEEAETSRFAATTATRPTVPEAPPPPAPTPAPLPPEPERPGRRRWLWGLLILALIGGVVWLAVYLAGRGEEPAPSASGTPTTAPATSSPTTASSTPPVTTATADFPGTAAADTASMQVVPLAPQDAKCTTHTFGGTAAYVSNCGDWGEQASVLYFFYVTLENKTTAALKWNRNAFTVSSGNDYQPADVGKQAADPTTFLPKNGTIGSQDSVSGYIAFRVDRNFDPTTLSYEKGALSLTIQFVGAKASVPATKA